MTTGRDRRCGWFDAPIARYATRVNGLTDIFLTKLDVLTGWDRIPVCVAYDVDGQKVDEIPMTQTDFHHAKPIYEYLPGWSDDISEARSLDELLKQMRGHTSSSSRISPNAGSRRSVSDRTATRRSRSTTSSANCLIREVGVNSAGSTSRTPRIVQHFRPVTTTIAPNAGAHGR